MVMAAGSLTVRGIHAVEDDFGFGTESFGDRGNEGGDAGFQQVADLGGEPAGGA